jgi:5-oxoprolinase (ATP-hydrolysing) subunit C
MATLRILRAGPGTTIQDGGRRGYLRFGVTASGPMDWIGHARANILAGNAARAAAIEVGIGGIELEAQGGAVCLGCAGAPFRLSRNGADLSSAGRLRLLGGERLMVKAAAQGAWFYLSPAGGVQASPVLDSLATNLRTGIGPPPLTAGDALEIGPATELNELICAPEPGPEPPLTLRVVLGPQDDYFSDQALAQFFGETYCLARQSDRMGYRLEGAPLRHAKDFNIVSDAIALGAIQVPGDGLPIVLMADHQPTGGYPKLGHVIQADIGRLAQCRPGAKVRFAQVSVQVARAELFAVLEQIRATLDRAEPREPNLSSERLFSMNLISGVCAP